MTVAIVTGANQGLGLALVRGLCRQLGQRASVYLTSRDRERGEAAVRQLAAEGLAPILHLLDVADDASVAMLAATVRERHGGVDILIANAAARMTPELSPAAQVRTLINTNNHGTSRTLRAFVPLLNDGARVLVVASSFGALRHLPERLRPRFDAARRSFEELEAEMDAYAAAVEAETAAEQGWPEWINIPSKVGQVTTMKILAREQRDQAEQRDILINAVCPGLIDTAASRPWFADMSQAQSPDEAAVDVLWLATLPAGTRTPYGRLVQHRRVLD